MAARSTVRRAFLTGALLAGAACSSVPDFAQGQGQGDLLTVTLLDAHFVRYQGERMPIEDFIYAARVKGREAFYAERPYPWVEVYVEGRDVPDSAFHTLQKALWDAGVQRIDPKFGSAGGA